MFLSPRHSKARATRGWRITMCSLCMRQLGLLSNTQRTVCRCVSVSVSVSVLPWLPIWFSCMSTQLYKVVKGTSKSSTTEMRTVMRTTDIPATKGSKLTWHEMWEINLVSIMKENFSEKDKDRSKYGWLPKMASCSKGSIGSLLASSFCARINSCANQVLSKLP